MAEGSKLYAAWTRMRENTGGDADLGNKDTHSSTDTLELRQRKNTRNIRHPGRAGRNPETEWTVLPGRWHRPEAPWLWAEPESQSHVKGKQGRWNPAKECHRQKCQKRWCSMNQVRRRVTQHMSGQQDSNFIFGERRRVTVWMWDTVAYKVQAYAF